MIRRSPNIRSKHFEVDEKEGEYTCKTCGGTYEEVDAIVHLMKVHGYETVDIILDEPLDD
ncbi:hypothetical protein SY89_02701 [Halolamina pelagica]|uniref:C2H2-type domain-containing protein n=1 Tax=Halolamina pelagica TaxID=699431 RepID=A0A0P7I4P9_9EURY|nr:hypothetical protein [Halolamina pelagica]KPN31944.1 hypothetical protein SY89_02701 [Halolamina pelagica]